MQLNIHVPKAREKLLHELEDAARETHHPKSQLVLDAIEMYVRDRRRKRRRVELPLYPEMKPVAPLRRTDLYDERLDRPPSLG